MSDAKSMVNKVTNPLIRQVIKQKEELARAQRNILSKNGQTQLPTSSNDSGNGEISSDFIDRALNEITSGAKNEVDGTKKRKHSGRSTQEPPKKKQKKEPDADFRKTNDVDGMEGKISSWLDENDKVLTQIKRNLSMFRVVDNIQLMKRFRENTMNSLVLMDEIGGIYATMPSLQLSLRTISEKNLLE